MGCGCKDKPARAVPKEPLACERCLEKHLCKALVYAAEAAEDERPVERALAHVNLMCAAEHAEALGDERAADVAAAAEGEISPAAIRALLPAGGDYEESAIGLLGVAEDALRFAGKPAAADAVRKIRISIHPPTNQQEA